VGNPSGALYSAQIKWESISIKFYRKNGTEHNSKEMEREGGREIKWESIFFIEKRNGMERNGREAER
jgi:hypothetical protein